MTVAKNINDLRQQVGQLLITGFDGVEISARLRSTFASLQPGGIILFQRNITAARQTWELLRESQKCITTPAFRCVDLEGGTVDRLKDVIAPVPSVADIAATGNKKLFRRHGRVLGDECRRLGFNVDFAPVVDLGLKPSRKVLTSRTASDDPEKVVAYAREFLRGLKDAGVLGCGKHFPGLGRANLDTHTKLPAITTPAARLLKEELCPYCELHRQMAFVMVAHAAYPAVTNDKTPASLSRKWITDILRKKIGYRGLALCDDLEMGGVLAAASVEEAAVETLKAGSDIFMVCHDEQKVWRAYEAVLSAAERDSKFAKLVREKARRVLSFKQRAHQLRRRVPVPTEKTLDRLRRQIWELSEEARMVAVAKA
ncbi:MAG: beta-N-acetylhexosaminidase [Acidobacteriia bacterium]|nr:beta-N-acetylhexosaminidase [Terriglobia bacterium]